MLMTKLLILLCNIFLGSAYFVVNCECDKSAEGLDVSATAKNASGNSLISTNERTTLGCTGNNLTNNIEISDVTDSDNTTELSSSPCLRQFFLPPPDLEPERGHRVCKEETQTVNSDTVIWPATEAGKSARSSPLCLDDRLIIVTRKCEDNWVAEPKCESIQKSITNPCPPDLYPTHDKYCYKIIEKTTFPTECPYPETIGWDEYVQLDLTKEPIWMPVTRSISEEYGTDVMRFTELTDKYSVPYEICTQSCRTYFYSDTFSDKLCQIYHNSTHIEAVSCDELHSGVCVYRDLSQRTTSFCAQVHPANSCKQSEYGTHSNCFCEAENNNQVGSSALAEFLYQYQNLIYNQLGKSCHIGLENTKDQSKPVPFIWSSSNVPILYTNWAMDVEVDFDNTYGVLTPTGWILESEKTADCVLYQIPAPTDKGTFTLDIEGDHFKLTIRNYKSFLWNDKSEPLFYCFTNADATSLVYRIQNFSKTSNDENDCTYTFSSLDLPQSGPGNYWCQAFIYPDLDVIESETIMLKKYKAEYVAILQLQHYEEKLSRYPLKTENLATLQNLFKNELEDSLSFFPRIFKLSEIDEIKRELTITFHLSSDTAEDSPTVFSTLKAASMAQNTFEFVDFRSVDYCPTIKTRQSDGQFITWPLTKLDVTTDPDSGFCVTDDVIFIQRTCQGNFIDGAYWSLISKNCTFYASSSETNKLIEITRTTDIYDSALTNLLAITENYDSFNTLDLVLTVKFLNDVSDKTPNLEIFAEIINNLMKISRPILLSSQMNFQATDTLLLSLDKALEYGDFEEHKTENFAIKSLSIKDEVYGILIQNCATSSSNCDLVPLTNPIQLTDESFIATNGVVAAVVISSALYYQIINYSNTNSSYDPKLVVSIYYGSQLFVELNNQKFSNLVFGVLIPGFTQEFIGPLSIYYFSDVKANFLGYNCSYWEFNSPDSSLWADEGTENINQTVYCEFYHLTNFGLPATVTEECCDKNLDSKENVDRLNNELKVSASSMITLVKYQSICEPLSEANVDYDANLLDNETLSCTLLVSGATNDPLFEYCVTENATAIPTQCFKNFNKDMHRFNISENCITYLVSDLLKILLDATYMVGDDCWGSVLDMLLQYSENYMSFTELDVIIVATIMSPIAYSKPDLQKVAGIVSNLIKTPNSVLNSAQQQFRAVDILLSNTEEALKAGDCDEWKTENFVIKGLNINGDNIGVMIENCSSNFSNCNLKPITPSDNLYDITTDSIQASISLADTLHDQILNYAIQNSSYSPRMIVSLYSGSQLFVELDDTSSEKHVFSFVFGILLPDFNEQFQSPILVYYHNNVTTENLLHYNCSYWKYNTAGYGSWMTENTNDNKQVALCEFYHVTNFAITIKFFNHSNKIHFHKIINKEPDVRHIFFNEKSTMCAPKKDQIKIFENTNSLNLMRNSIGQLDIFSNDDYFSYLTNEYYSGLLSSYIPTIGNELIDITPSSKEYMWNQSITCIQQRPNSISTRLSYDLDEKDKKDITYELEIFNSNISTKNTDKIKSRTNMILAKLEYLLLNSFDDLNSQIIQLLATQLQKNESLTKMDILQKLANIINITMKTPKKIMIKVQKKFNLADKILYSIDNILQKFKAPVQIKKENVILLIISKEDVLHFFGFYITKDREVVYITNKNKEENKFGLEIDFRVMISSQLHEQISVRKTRIIFVIFYNDIYFPDEENNVVTNPIIEVVFPDLEEALKADFTITYRFTYGLNQFSKCSYWDHLVTANNVVKSGSWKKELPALFNGSWVTCVFNHATHFALVTSSQNITTELEDILSSNLTGLEKLKQVDSITYNSHSSLLPVDIFLISQIIGRSLTEGTFADVISKIISNLFNVPQTVLRESQEIHTSTDIILHNVDKMAQMLDDTFISFDNFSLIVKDLNTVNLTGILLHNCNESMCSIDQLNDFVNISEYVNDDEMSAMVIFNEDLVTQIRNLTVSSKVIISIYYSNVFFNEIDKDRNTTKVFGVVIPGLNTSLDGKVSVIYNVKTNINDVHQCAYWYYKVDPDGDVDNAAFGKWENDTARKMLGQIAICNFSHVTHFSMLLSNNDSYNDDPILQIITDIGCILSIIGIIIILLTAIFFKRWRQNTGNKILINFSIAISLKIGMLYLSEYIKTTSTVIGCTISGTVLHYAILSECAWMLTIAILQFKRFVEVLGGPPKYVLVKALICGWVFPIMPVICVILIDPDNYLQGNSGLCYPSNLGLYLGVWLPVIIIVSINCVIFIFIIYNVFHKKTEYIDSANCDILFQWRLALLLFFMLGLTWSFGFLSEINEDALFTYVFCITASMQGFVLFLFFIVFNKSTRVLYSHSAKQWFYSKGIFKLWQTKS